MLFLLVQTNKLMVNKYADSDGTDNFNESIAKRCDVSRYPKYHMVDERCIKAQCQELQKIVHELITEGMPLNKKFQIVVIVDHLPLVGKILTTYFTIK